VKTTGTTGRLKGSESLRARHKINHLAASTLSFRHAVTCSFRNLPRFRSGISPLTRGVATLLHCSFGVELGHVRGLVAAERAQLGVGQVGVTALPIAKPFGAAFARLPLPFPRG